LKNVFRPGHADYTYQEKFGLRDYRGGGRSSIRITAPLVAAGAIAQQVVTKLTDSIVFSFVSQIGKAQYDVATFSDKGLTSEEIEYLSSSDKNFLDEKFHTLVTKEIEAAEKEGDTLGGRITTLIENLPAGIGEPIFGKLQARLSQVMMSINTVKAIEFGEGQAASALKGSEHNDSFEIRDGEITTATNHHGGILGGISSGERINFSIYFKPISSIKRHQSTLTSNKENIEINIEGRHDVCAVPRAVPIVEAYTYIVLADLLLKNRNAKI
jgi:chorismate synthase